MTEEEIENRLLAIEKQIEQISARNSRVESEKSWEISKFRIFSICILTWIVISIVFWLINVNNYFMNALIPTIAFYISSQSLPLLKRIWVKHIQ